MQYGELHKLLFELSSAERINIMLEVQKNRSKLSHISRQQDMTVTETSRHLQRLSDSRLIEKGADGLYGLSSYGELVLEQLSGLGFVAKHQEYFLQYDLSCLPYEFIGRMGELAKGEFRGDILANFELTENEFRRADKFIWILSDQILKSLIPVVAEKLKQPFDFRFISPQAVMPHDSIAPLPSTMPGVKKRFLPKVDVVVIVTDKAAGFCFPQRSGKIDYRNFNGADPKFRKWCKDLFCYYWDKAQPVVPI